MPVCEHNTVAGLELKGGQRRSSSFPTTKHVSEICLSRSRPTDTGSISRRRVEKSSGFVPCCRMRRLLAPRIPKDQHLVGHVTHSFRSASIDSGRCEEAGSAVASRQLISAPIADSGVPLSFASPASGEKDTLHPTIPKITRPEASKS